MLSGILATGSVNLQSISRSLKEDILCKYTHKRLCRQIWQNGPVMELANNYILKSTSKLIKEDSCIYLDGGDITYNRATSYENMNKVKDGSIGAIKNGYVSNLIVCRDSSDRVYPVCFNIFHRQGDYKSDNQETIKIMDMFINKNGNKGIWVLDRVYDRGIILDKLISHKCNFIIRMIGNRYLDYKENKILISDLSNNNPLKYHYKGGKYHYKKCYYKTNPVTMIYYKKYNVDMKLLVSKHITNKQEAELSISRYLSRWSVEDGHRFIKQAFMLEKARTSKFESTKCLAGLSILAWFVLYKIANNEELKYALLKKSKTEKPKIVKFDYYRLIRGIIEVFKLSTEMFRFRTVKKHKKMPDITYFLTKYDKFAHIY